MDTSLLIGIVIGAAGTFFAGFLKKAGEESFSSIKDWVNPKPPAAAPPPVVVQVLDNRGNTHIEGTLIAQSAPIPIERLSQVTFDEIEKAIESAPPMQREQIANGYVGLKVEWDSYLRSATRIDNGEVSLRLSIDKDYRLRAVTCKVKEEEYRVLGVLSEGTYIRVAGEITNASNCDVKLSNVRLQIFNNAQIV
jgi:hypothetical protein